MGDKIKTLAKGEIKKTIFEIELNKGSSINAPRSIHIQSKSFRVDFDEIEFMKLAMTILSAKKRLLVLKGDM